MKLHCSICNSESCICTPTLFSTVAHEVNQSFTKIDPKKKKKYKYFENNTSLSSNTNSSSNSILSNYLEIIDTKKNENKHPFTLNYRQMKDNMKKKKMEANGNEINESQQESYNEQEINNKGGSMKINCVDYGNGEDKMENEYLESGDKKKVGDNKCQRNEFENEDKYFGDERIDGNNLDEKMHKRAKRKTKKSKKDKNYKGIGTNNDVNNNLEKNEDNNKHFFNEKTTTKQHFNNLAIPEDTDNVTKYMCDDENQNKKPHKITKCDKEQNENNEIQQIIKNNNLQNKNIDNFCDKNNINIEDTKDFSSLKNFEACDFNAKIENTTAKKSEDLKTQNENIDDTNFEKPNIVVEEKRKKRKYVKKNYDKLQSKDIKSTKKYDQNGTKRDLRRKIDNSSSEDFEKSFLDVLDVKKGTKSKSLHKNNLFIEHYNSLTEKDGFVENIFAIKETLKVKLKMYRDLMSRDLSMYSGFYITIDKMLVPHTKEKMFNYCEKMVGSLENEIQRLDDHLGEYFEKIRSFSL